ncbi:hypothetical protein H6G18_15060 [Anabaena subtropica FACHB-260]|uniref:Uncharacterized protein n=1 Tax=Anabaena subtropica FACHB-260 TaxID=2692884 RepID=A0ABR8CQI8_9NOST|nr:hypothetical protein [Anabaena subtropica FACHB-260]
MPLYPTTLQKHLPFGRLSDNTIWIHISEQANKELFFSRFFARNSTIDEYFINSKYKMQSLGKQKVGGSADEFSTLPLSMKVIVHNSLLSTPHL